MAYTHSQVAATILRNPEGKVLLIQRTMKTKRFPGMFCLPCGKVDAGNTLAFAAARETWEEVGVTVEEGDLQLMAIMDRPNWPDGEAPRVLETFFIAKKWSGVPVNKEPNKHGDPVWASLNDLPQPLHLYTADALANLDSGQVLYKVYNDSLGLVGPSEQEQIR